MTYYDLIKLLNERKPITTKIYLKYKNNKVRVRWLIIDKTLYNYKKYWFKNLTEVCNAL